MDPLIKRVWKLAIMVMVGFSLVWLIPSSGEFRDSKLIGELPKQLIGRVGVELDVSDKERKVLAEDTTFARKRYFDDKVSNANPYIDVSVVFSGKDINNSIHRPEVCLEAQGWKFLSEEYITIKAGEIVVPFKEIVCSRARVATDGLPDKNSKGETIVDTRVQYYSFVGEKMIVAGHYERTWEDIKTRIIKGTDQQWAYITISMDVTKNPTNDIKKAQGFKLFDVEHTRESLQSFIANAMPHLLER